jgi:ATP-binding cassette subfamily C protein
LEGGRLVELGAHAKLLARGGRYAALWASWRGDTR